MKWLNWLKRKPQEVRYFLGRPDILLSQVDPNFTPDYGYTRLVWINTKSNRFWVWDGYSSRWGEPRPMWIAHTERMKREQDIRPLVLKQWVDGVISGLATTDPPLTLTKDIKFDTDFHPLSNEPDDQ